MNHLARTLLLLPALLLSAAPAMAATPAPLPRDSVYQLATPLTFTAGPMTSFTGAVRSLRVYCARASLIMPDDSVDRKLVATV